MLQPNELHGVATQFAEEIGTLRKFLAIAAVPLDSSRTMHELVSRIRDDANFHRDLTSHIWALLDESGSGIRSGELLAIVAIAAAGESLAAGAAEDDALGLLRFTMEARHALEKPVKQPTRSTPRERVPAGVMSPQKILSSTPSTALNASLAPSPGQASPEPSIGSAHRPNAFAAPLDAGVAPRRRSGFVLGLVLGILCLIGCCWYLLARRQVTDVQHASTAAPQSRATKDVFGLRKSQAPQSPPVAGPFGAARPAPMFTPRAEPSWPKRPAQSAAGSLAPTEMLPPVSKLGPAAVQPSSSPVALPQGGDFPTTATPPPVLAKGTGTAKSARSGSVGPPIPSDVLSKRLDSPTLPAYATGAEAVEDKKHPHLLRRSPATNLGGQGEDEPRLSADLRAPDLPGVPRPGSAAITRAKGVVRSTCLGMMAGNVIYSPAPPYPSAAAAAQVQGEVKIQATVDRDGTINAARVISGPPLLREAALSAVQQWRYKPFLTAGKAAPAGTVAVVDFELQ